MSHVPFRGTYVRRERADVVIDFFQGVVRVDVLGYLLSIMLTTPFEGALTRASFLWGYCCRGLSSFNRLVSTAASHGHVSRFSLLASTAVGRFWVSSRDCFWNSLWDGLWYSRWW